MKGGDLMEFIILLLFPIIHILSSRLEWRYNQWLFIDLYIGRENFYNFLKKNSNITIFNDIEI